MKNYKKAISEIKVSEEFKNNLIKNLNEKQSEIYAKENIKLNKKHKFRNSIITIASILGLLGGSGLVYAGLTGSLKFGDRGIEFSQNISEYREEVKNQKLEKDGNTIELTSKVCDDGFLMLQFNVTLSDEVKTHADEYGGIEYISFNDNKDGISVNGKEAEPRLHGSNYNLIIDGKNYWLRGATDSEIIENIENNNYTFYQLWFLSEEEIGNKEEFTVTLEDVVIKVGENLYEFDGKFDIDVSKTKAMANTKIYEPEDVEIKYKSLTSKIEKLIESPMQTLVKTNTTIDNVTKKNFNNYSVDDCVNNWLEYKVYDQNDNEISEFDVITKYVYYYNDGTSKSTDDEEGKFEWDGFYKYDTENYIAVAQNDEVTDVTIEVYEKNEYKGILTNIGEFKINLKSGKIQTKNKNEVEIYDENSPSTWEINSISPQEIKEFEINIPDGDYTITRRYENAILINGKVEAFNEAETEENYDFVTYDISLDESGDNFSIIIFKNKEIYTKDFPFVSGDEGYTPKKIAENDKYILVLNALSDYQENEIKDIIESINLK